jgi:hypothetical protein
MYCQSEIEFNKRCDVQCEHCKEYYGPLEEDHAAGDYADMVNPTVLSNHSSNPEWRKSYDAFIAGCNYTKNNLKLSNYVDTDPKKVF